MKWALAIIVAFILSGLAALYLYQPTQNDIIVYTEVE